MKKIIVNTDPRTLPDARAELLRVQGEASTLENDLEAAIGEQAKPEDSVALIELQGKLDGANTEITSLKADLATAKATISTLQGEVTAKGMEISTLTTNLATAKTAVTDFDTKVSKVANDKAIDFLASKGMAPAQIGLTSGEKLPSAKRGRERLADAINKELTGTK